MWICSAHSEARGERQVTHCGLQTMRPAESLSERPIRDLDPQRVFTQGDKAVGTVGDETQ